MKTPKLPPLTSPTSPTSPTDKALYAKWKRILHFRVGEPGLAVDEMLPDSSRFPQQYLGPRLQAETALGEVLGTAALKIYRGAAGHRPALPPGDDVILTSLFPRWPNALDERRASIVDRFIGAALNAPQCLPALVARLDAIGNDELRAMALLAARGVSVPSIFDGLAE